MLSIFIQNFGCRVNQAEAFAWAETLQAGGLRLAEDWRTADVIIVNTCTLTGRADRDVNRFLRRAVRENPTTRLAITGCASEQLPKDILGSSHVILTLPNSEKEQLAAKLLALIKAGRREDSGSNNSLSDMHGVSKNLRSVGGSGHRERPAGAWRSQDGETEDGRLDGEGACSYRARAYLKIQDGCDNHCTFCVIPRVRGRSKSVPVDNVVARVKDLTADGFHEIVLAGIHLSSYGEDLGETMTGPDGRPGRGKITLADLLRRIQGVRGLGRLRLSSLDPRRIDDSFMTQVAGNLKICQHFHLSLQHASANILRKMGRLVPRLYEALLSRLRAASPDAAIGADIIVGFPGETEEDFEVLEKFLERSPLSYFHVFSYSPRRGTPAAGWAQVPDAVKSARAKRLRRLSAAKNLAFRQSFVGKELDAVVITTAPSGGDIKRDGNQGVELLTGNYIRVTVPSCLAERRDLVRIRITRVLPDRTEGTVV